HTVTFKNPDFKVRAIHAGSWYLSVVVYEKDKKSMEARRAPLRPFFSPIAIHPKYARYLVNTTETKPKDTILDPFCGTGGILLEAGLMGRRIKGNDFSLNMVKGARLNLKYFNLKDYTILNRDIADLELDTSVDGIATDLPYGRNSNMKAESLRDLYRTAFAKFHELLKPGGVASIIISDTDLLVFADGLFESGKIVGVPQHRSLTRYFVHLKKLDT
ncbi:MAG TPA: methyltransferase domain-containing protein, partial [Thermoplasmataceae archaeon]|nr:methyltransferase domain-containing protein [Thermoplasmataceae archaeon]